MLLKSSLARMRVLALGLKKAKHVFLDLSQPLFVHCFTPVEIMQRINTDNTDQHGQIVVDWLYLTAPPKGETMKKLLVVCLGRDFNVAGQRVVYACRTGRRT